MYVAMLLALALSMSPDDQRVRSQGGLPPLNRYAVECHRSWVVLQRDSTSRTFVAWVDHSTWFGFSVVLEQEISIDPNGRPRMVSTDLDSSSVLILLPEGELGPAMAPLPEAWRRSLNLPAQPDWADPTPPDDASAAWIDMAWLALSADRPTAAERYLRKMKPTASDRTDYQHALGATLLDLARPAEAIKLLHEAYAADTMNADVSFTLAEAYLSISDSARAIRQYRSTLRKCAPGDRDMTRRLAYGLAFLYASCGDRAGFHRWVGRVERLSPPSSAERMILHAMEAFTFGSVDAQRVPEAFEPPKPLHQHYLSTCEGKWILVKFPGTDTLGLGYVSIDDSLGLMLGIEAMLQIDDHGIARGRRPGIFRKDPITLGLEKYLPMKVAICPPEWLRDMDIPRRPQWVRELGTRKDSIARKLSIAERFMAQRRYDMAIAILSAAYDAAPSNVHVVSSLAAARMGANELTAARNLLEHALSLDPGSWKTHRLLGDLSVREIRFVRALEHYRSAFTASSKQAASTRSEIVLAAAAACAQLNDKACFAEWERLAAPLTSKNAELASQLRALRPK